MKLGFSLRRAPKRNKPLEYHFLPYVTSVLRVLGWAVLVIGVIASIVFGLGVVENGMTIRGIELTGIGPGVGVIILGIVGSFLAWLFLLVSRELVYLFIHVKNNTASTAKCLTHESY